MKATNTGSLNPISDCSIFIPGCGDELNAGLIELNNLPDISDSKDAVYNSEAIIGRSTPLYTYSHSGDRTISIQIHLYVVDKGDAERNLTYLRWIQSALYPRIGDKSTPFTPPVICQIKCGSLLAKDEPLCCFLKQYNVKFPTDVAWEEETFCPYKLDIDTTWTVVYSSENLPFQKRIVKSGR